MPTYNRLGRAAGKDRPAVTKMGNEINKRGSTFGYSESHGDHYPTLGMLMSGRLAEGEDLRFSDTEPPSSAGKEADWRPV